eukprot:scaffold207_cov409-Prasinococcus_capsulatus_cf.AAC.134
MAVRRSYGCGPPLCDAHTRDPANLLPRPQGVAFRGSRPRARPRGSRRVLFSARNRLRTGGAAAGLELELRSVSASRPVATQGSACRFTPRAVGEPRSPRIAPGVGTGNGFWARFVLPALTRRLVFGFGQRGSATALAPGEGSARPTDGRISARGLDRRRVGGHQGPGRHLVATGKHMFTSLHQRPVRSMSSHNKEWRDEVFSRRMVMDQEPSFGHGTRVRACVCRKITGSTAARRQALPCVRQGNGLQR